MADEEIWPAELNEPDFVDDDYDESPPTDIVSYNELRSCADLYRMYDEEILQIDPDFQREVVWPPSQQTRFIDSLIKQLPIPSMCIALDYKTEKWIVIDGLQRMATIIKFLKGDKWRMSRLKDIDSEIAGKTVATLKASTGKSKAYFSRVQNQSLPINVLRCDFSKKSHQEYLFTIFHRLNSGGLKLNNQEIRNCIYSGPFNALISTLDKREGWRKTNRMMNPNSSYRFVKQELILRFFAFLDSPDKYKGQIAKFLNDYMHDHRQPDAEFIEDKTKLFDRVVAIFADRIFPEGPTERIPTSMLEATLVGLARNIDFVEGLEPENIKGRYDELRAREEFNEEAVAEGLSKKDKVEGRLNAAVQAFSPA